MMNITMCSSAEGAKKYYLGKYYSEGQTLDAHFAEIEKVYGTWGGNGAARLGLIGEVQQTSFNNLCDNINPNTQESLTERNNSNRRVAWDVTFNASKSVSLAWMVGNPDEKHEIMTAFNEANDYVMGEIEKDMQARVRVNGQDTDRNTGNIIWAGFNHFTTRPVTEKMTTGKVTTVDPQLHKHNVVFNATFDDEEKKVKACQFGYIKENAPYYETMFHSVLAEKMQALGYHVERNRNNFELAGVNRETIEKFSKRTKQIDEFAEKEGITSAKRKAAIGSITRESKQVDLDPNDVWQEWHTRLSPVETLTLENLKGKPIANESRQAAYDAVQYALDHHLERKSVSDEKEILTTAIKVSIGEASHKNVISALHSHKDVIWVEKELTTKQALQEENNLIKTANEFRGRFRPINKDYKFKNELLTDEQKKAVSEALTSKDGIVIIGGKAGTGKTTLMKEVQTGIKDADKEIFAFAPTNEASRGVQRSEGFHNAETVASLLGSKELQKKVKNGVIWVDEAGMLPNVDMNGIMAVAKEQNARIVLTGDTKQHTSVQRGDAMRILQTYAGFSPVMVTKIQRQTNNEYKRAAESFSKGNPDKALSILNSMGALHEIENHDERVKAVAEDYVRSSTERQTFFNQWGDKKNIKGGGAYKDVLVVAPSHKEGEAITKEIRLWLNIKDRREHLTYQPLNYTEAEKSRIENYQPGQFLIFHTGKQSGSIHEIKKAEGDKVELKSGLTITLDKRRNFNVFEGRKKDVGVGDKIRLNGKTESVEGTHLFNGSIFQVKKFDHEGRMVLNNGSTLPKGFGRFNYGYVTTSNSSQGKTVDKVIIAQSAMSGLAATGKQGYVSMTRGRKEIAWYTDDKSELLQAVGRTGDRKSALELVNKVNDMKRRRKVTEPEKPKDKTKVKR